MSKRVLIVDDAAFMRMLLKDMVTKAGFEIVGEAINGKEAIEKYKELNPDVVAIDTIMPEMNGIEATKEIMKLNPNAKIIICSAMGQQMMVMEALQSGAKDFVVKPFRQDKITETLSKVMSGRQ
ncbi:MAG: response regulator [Thermotogae bacterium]|nr:response regulator [Thermotogota bacterium]MCL5032655.1 response regulator [Thermotogota bacterium]